MVCWIINPCHHPWQCLPHSLFKTMKHILIQLVLSNCCSPLICCSFSSLHHILVNKVFQYTHAPTINHWFVVKRILWDLYATNDYDMLIRQTSGFMLHKLVYVGNVVYPLYLHIPRPYGILIRRFLLTTVNQGGIFYLFGFKLNLMKRSQTTHVFLFLNWVWRQGTWWHHGWTYLNSISSKRT